MSSVAFARERHSSALRRSSAVVGILAASCLYERKPNRLVRFRKRGSSVTCRRPSTATLAPSIGQYRALPLWLPVNSPGHDQSLLPVSSVSPRHGLRYARQSPVTHGPSRPQSVRNKGSLHSGIGLVCSRDGRPVLAGGTSQQEL